MVVARRILIYSYLMVVVSLLLVPVGQLGAIYLVSALLSGEDLFSM